MGDGWTGINIEGVKSDLTAFYEAMKQIQTDYRTDFDYFNDELYRAWASPKAADFNGWLVYAARVYRLIGKCTNDILVSATNAADYMARGNGSSFSYEFERLYDGANNEFKHLEEEKDGVTGMNIPMAKFAFTDFTNACNNIIAALGNVPMNFSLLDPEGSLLAEYKRLVNDLTLEIDENLSDLSKQLEEAYKEEELQITLGKTQAEQQLSA